MEKQHDLLKSKWGIQAPKPKAKAKASGAPLAPASGPPLEPAAKAAAGGAAQAEQDAYEGVEVEDEVPAGDEAAAAPKLSP
eukprot:3103773-Amphidinium_carterae.1